MEDVTERLPDAELRERYENGASLRSIAQEDGRAVMTIRRRLVASGVRLRTRGEGTRLRTPSAEVRFSQAITQGQAPSRWPGLGPCLLYTGGINSSGYGQFSYNGRGGYAHRYAWERVNGPIPAEMTIDHLCMVRTCVNVTHLEVVDGPTNTRRGVAKRQFCLNGLHELIPENVELRRGLAACKRCRQETSRRDRQRRARLANGLPDRRKRYSSTLRDELIQRCLAGDLTVRQAAEELGCAVKYMDKRVRAARRLNEQAQ